MREFGQSLMAACLAAGASLAAWQDMPPGRPAAPPTKAPPAVQAPSPQAVESAARILAEARNALGGERKQAAVRTIVATGRTRRVSGENLVPVEFEMSLELPDKYVRKDEIPAQETEPTSSGFNGDSLIQIPPPPPPAASPAGAVGPAAAGRAAAPAPDAAPAARTAAPAPAAGPAAGAAPAGARAAGPMTVEQRQEAQRRSRVSTLKQDFARLTLGMFAASFSSFPLTFAHAGQAEAPQGKADVIDVRGPGSFTARLFVMSDTHLPVMLSWTTPVTPANIVILSPGQAKPATLAPGAIVVEGPAPPAPSASKEDQDAHAGAVAALRQKTMASAKPIENRLYYADYRDVDGLQFPFKLRRAVGADTIEETTFDRFRLNTRIDPKKFEPVK